MSKKDMNKGYNIALHSIRTEEGSKEIAESIMENGLNIRPGTSSIRCTTIQLGDKYRNKNFRQELDYNLENYRVAAGSEGYTIVVASPTVLENSNGEKLFLGDPYMSDDFQDAATSGQQYGATCILDIVCTNLGKIPPEFILGYTKDGVFINNPNHYSKQSGDKSKIDELYATVRGSLSSVELAISISMASGKFKELENAKTMLRKFQKYTLLNIIERAEQEYGKTDKDEIDV